MLIKAGSLDLPIADIIIAVILLIVFLIGFHKGFFGMLFWLFGTIISIIAAVFLAPLLRDLLQQWFGLTNILAAVVRSWLPVSSAPWNADVTVLGLEGALKTGVPDFLAGILVKVVDVGELPEGTILADVAAPILGGYLSLIICFFIAFILVAIVMMILKSLLKALNKSLSTKLVGKFLGGFLGIAIGLIFIYLIIGVVTILPAAWIGPVNDEINNSIAAKAMRDFNIVMLALKQIGPIAEAIKALEDLIKSIS